MADPLECDIAIVGLGPTGAMLANLLGQYGWSVVGVERDEDIYYAPRAVHFDDEIMRIFQFAGLADEIAGTSEPFREMAFLLRAGGPPALKSEVGSQGEPYGWPGAYWFHQPTLEKHFRDGLARFSSVRALYGHVMTALRQDARGVEIATTALDGSTQAIRAKYVIGCDGGRSAVRREAGIALDSAEFDEPWVVVDAKARSGGKDPSLPPNHFQVCDPTQPVTYVPMTGPYYEWQFMVVDGKSEREATDPAYVRSQLRNFVDPDQIEIIRIAYYNFHALWARTWRNGRIILAGDSAHQMPPFLGQGMCSGVRDAMSLAWRLDLILAGKTDERVLQHYEDERAKHVRHIIEGAMFLGNVIQTRKPAVAAARNVFAFFLPSVLAPMREAFTALANRKRPIECGFIGKTAPKLAGTFLPQPRVGTMKGEALLDDVIGKGSVVLCRASVLSKVRGAVLASGLELGSFGFERSPAEGVVGDASGALEHWFQRAGVDLVVVRPDRVVFDGGSLRELPSLLKAFGAPFLQQSPVVRAA